MSNTNIVRAWIDAFEGHDFDVEEVPGAGIVGLLSGVGVYMPAPA